jgi:hypothetical protein
MTLVHVFQSAETSSKRLGESRRFLLQRGASMCCGYLFFPPRKSTPWEKGPLADLLIRGPRARHRVFMPTDAVAIARLHLRSASNVIDISGAALSPKV